MGSVINDRSGVQLLAALKAHIPYPVSITNREGIIVASTIAKRVGQKSETAAEMMDRYGLGEKTKPARSANEAILSVRGAIQGVVEIVDLGVKDRNLLPIAKTIAELVLENMALAETKQTNASAENKVLSVLVGVHPADKSGLLASLAEIGFDIAVPHSTLFIELAKRRTIVVDAGERELILDSRQVEAAEAAFLEYLSDSFSGGQNFVLIDSAEKNALILYAEGGSNEDINLARLLNICTGLQNRASGDFCLELYAAVGSRCRELADYERQYEQLIKRLNAGKMMFPDHNIFWGSSIVLGSFVFHTGRVNRQRIVSYVLRDLLESNHADVYLETLHAFFQCGMNYTQTAQRLFIHRNTLQYRIKKIEELTSTNMDDVDSLLSLRLALLCHSSILIEDRRR